MTIWRMQIACLIPKTTNTHSEYVIPIAFPLQQWLHELVPVLCYSTLPVLFVFVLERVLFPSETCVGSVSNGMARTMKARFLEDSP